MLEIREIFLSIQGEGPFAGTPAVFIRLAGCNLSCSYCDTDHESEAKRMLAVDIVDSVLAFTQTNKVELVVITGGEPFLQAISELVSLLFQKSFKIQVETNGTTHQPGFPWPKVSVVCSPKEETTVHPIMVTKVYAWKYLISEQTPTRDGVPLNCTPPPFGARVYLQPIDVHDSGQNARNWQITTDLCIKHGFRLSLQTHKFLGIP